MYCFGQGSGKNKQWKTTKIKEKNNRDFYELIGIDKAKETKSDKSF